MLRYILDSYKEVRKKSPLGAFHNYVFIDFFFSARISPIFTIYFMKQKISPNTITIYMILSGWLGAFLFAFDNIYLKIIGYIFIHLWFIFDASDGEVARITKTFSKMGKELDFVAHIVNHPMFAISFAISMLQLTSNTISDFWILAIFSLLIVFNLIGRGLMSLNLIYDIKSESEATIPGKLTIKKFIIYISSFFCQFPNIATIFPLFYFIDLYFETTTSLFYLSIVTLTTILIVARIVYSTMTKFYKL